MNSTIFSENLKKFRLAKKYTQEQVADILNVNSQTVSRWECGTTLPDVMMLPQIAKLYEVTVDDFYKKHSIAYENYAQRLCSVYEKTRKPEDFFDCYLEYKKLMKETNLSILDKWNYAIIHQWMLDYCKNTALEWYDNVLAENPESDPHSYYRARDCRQKLMFDLGKGEECILEQKMKLESTLDNPREWDGLILAYIWAKRYEDGYACFLKAIERFPEDWILYIHGGDICEQLGRYEDAFTYWSKAGEIGTYFYDDLYCKASCLEEMGEYEKSAQMYRDIAEKLRKDGYDVEAEMAEHEARKVKDLMKK